MNAANVSTFITSTLRDLGVRYIFGVSGGSIVPFFRALQETPGITAVLAKHEQGAAFMADGFARVSRHIGVCCTTSGPGATNALTGVYAANIDGSQVLVLTGQPSLNSFGKGPLQDSSGVDQALSSPEVFRSATRFSEMVLSPQQAPQLLYNALRAMQNGHRGAAHLSIPANLLAAPVDSLCSVPHPVSPPATSIKTLKQLAKLLVSAKRPVILAGHGVINAQGEFALAALAEFLQIPVATTLKGKGAFLEHHNLSIGVFGSFTTQAIDRILSPDTDLLLVIGSSLNEVATGGWPPALNDHAVTLQIDISPSSLGRNYAFDHLIQADARIVLEELLPLVIDETTARPALPPQHAPRLKSHDVQPPGTPLKPQTVALCLSEHLPSTAKLFIDAGNCLSWAGEFIETRAYNSIFVPIGAGTMGCSIPMAIGGKFACPDRPVVSLIGDASFMMTAMEIHTSIEYERPIVIVVLNNGGHGMVYGGERILWEDEVLSRFQSRVDIAALANGLGANACVISTLAAFERAFTDALASDTTTVLDVHVDIEEMPVALTQRVNTLKQYFGVSS